MVALSLKIGVGNVVKTMQFEPSTVVYDACRIIRERVPEAQLGQREFWLLPLTTHIYETIPVKRRPELCQSCSSGGFKSYRTFGLPSGRHETVCESRGTFG